MPFPLGFPFSLPSGSALVVSGDIQDHAYNLLATPASASMLGWQEEAAEEQELALRIYLFLIEGIRLQDAQDGNLFVKRFLEGPQEVWGQTYSNIFAIQELWDVSRIPARFLPYLKRIVGWTPDLDVITEALDDQTLRRLIAASARLWKTRGPEDTLGDIVGLITGARNRILNYFDWRWVLDETGLGHEDDGHDPWTIGEADDRTFNLRIMDDGTLNRDLVRNLARLMRPSGERIEINYLLALDRFTTDGDNTLWEASPPLWVENGTANLEGPGQGGAAALAISGSDLWNNYLATLRVRGTFYPSDPFAIWGVAFLYQDDQNHMAVYADHEGQWVLISFVAGVITALDSAPHPRGLFDPDEWSTVRIQVTPEAGQVRIVVYVDGVEIMNLLDSTFTAGPPGIVRLTTTAAVFLDSIEVMALPAETDLIDINS